MLRLTVSQSVSLGVEPHLGLMTRYLAITNWQLRSCFCGAPSLTRGRVCLLYMLLGLPKAVFPGSDFLGTRDHILLSQMWDFTFRHFLRHAGSRWRYSTPPPPGLNRSLAASGLVLHSLGTDNAENTVLFLSSKQNKSRDGYITSPLAHWRLPSNKQ
jgi:hypothetical protein